MHPSRVKEHLAVWCEYRTSPEKRKVENLNLTKQYSPFPSRQVTKCLLLYGLCLKRLCSRAEYGLAKAKAKIHVKNNFLISDIRSSRENLNPWPCRTGLSLTFSHMNECVFLYRTYHMMSHGGLQCYWVRSNVSLWRRLWLPLSVHLWSHSPTQPMHKIWDRPPHREHRPLLFPTSAWVL